MAFDPVALGDELIDAGQKQVVTGEKLKQASVGLRGSVDELVTGGRMRTSIDSIRDGLQSLRALLSPVVTALQFIVTALNGISIPTISRQTRSIDIPVIGQITVVTGVTIGSTNPFAAIATRVDTVRTNISTIRDTLQTIRSDLLDLRNELPNIRTNLLNAANEMDSGGGNLIVSGNTLQTAGTQLGGSP